MQCSCGAVSETIHRVVRAKELQGEYQKCSICGRILWLWKSKMLENEIKQDYIADPSK